MAHCHTDEFRREAVRIALTGGLTRKPVASDLGMGFLTLSNWRQQTRHKELPTASDIELVNEKERFA
ncbi:MAG: transposase [Rhizobiaceae bacterium]